MINKMSFLKYWTWPLHGTVTLYILFFLRCSNWQYPLNPPLLKTETTPLFCYDALHCWAFLHKYDPIFQIGITITAWSFATKGSPQQQGSIDIICSPGCWWEIGLGKHTMGRPQILLQLIWFKHLRTRLMNNTRGIRVSDVKLMDYLDPQMLSKNANLVAQARCSTDTLQLHFTQIRSYIIHGG